MHRCYICEPAYGLSQPADFALLRRQAAQVAQALGWELVESPLLKRFTGERNWHCATARRADFANALTHEVAWAVRGGVGTIDLLDDCPSPAKPPLLIGFSDITCLHALWRKRGWGESLYGAMPGYAYGPRAQASLISMAKGEGFTLGDRDEPAVQVLHTGGVAGWLFPACLRVLATMIGTPHMPSLRGAIVALEDIDERPHAVFRDLTQLRQAGCLDGIAGLACGSFPCKLPQRFAGPSSTSLLRDLARSLGVPAIIGLGFGHIADPRCMPVGRSARLEATPTRWRLGVEARSG